MNNTTVSVLRDISIGGYTIAGIFMIMSIILFFKCQIPVIIGEMTGSTKKKRINHMRENKNFVKKEDSYQNLKKNHENNNISTIILTDIKQDIEQDTVLLQDDYHVDAKDEEATMVLKDNMDSFVMLKNIVIIHTGEIIEYI